MEFIEQLTLYHALLVAIVLLLFMQVRIFYNYKTDENRLNKLDESLKVHKKLVGKPTWYPPLIKVSNFSSKMQVGKSMISFESVA